VILFHFFVGVQRRKLRMVCLAIMLIISPDDMAKDQRIKASGWLAGEKENKANWEKHRATINKKLKIHKRENKLCILSLPVRITESPRKP
jgi:hypothetical protein